MTILVRKSGNTLVTTHTMVLLISSNGIVNVFFMIFEVGENFFEASSLLGKDIIANLMFMGPCIILIVE